MRNLRSLGHWFRKAPEDSTAPCTCAWDTSNSDIICAYGPTSSDSLISLQRWTPGADGTTGTTTHIASWDAPCPSPDLPCDKVLEIRYFADNSSTCLVFAGGDVVVVRESPLPGQEKIEILGSVDVGISAAAWSPDEELLVILTNAATLLYMSREFESITDIVLKEDDLKASKHVSVGWGKAETQFRGKGAKALRDPTMPEKVDQGLKSPHDDNASTISWRGDGAFVAVNSLQESTRRVIRVYSREGELDGVTEPVDYLESALSWRPSGNLIAGVQRLQDKIDIVFFERNGLRHGQFSLRLNADELSIEAPTVVLKWNQDSTVLAVCLPNRVQLWTMGNYHYYLKQEIYHQSNEPLSLRTFFSWHPEQALLFVIGHNGCVQKSEYGWRYSNGTNIQPFDSGLTSVIDGKTLKITPLRLSNVPPPMSLLEIEVGDPIVDLAYYDNFEKGNHEILIAILDSKSLSVYGWNPKERPFKQPKLKSLHDISTQINHGAPSCRTYARQIGFLSGNRVAVMVDSDSSDETIVYDFGLSLQNPDPTIENMQHIRELLPVYQGQNVKTLIWLSKAVILELQQNSTTNGPLSNGTTYTRLEVPSNLQSVILRSQNEQDAVETAQTVFGLRKNGMLFANKHCLAKDCTSFLVTNDHLVYTTSQHLLKFVHLSTTSTVEELEIPPDTPEADERCRSVERGARIVNVIPSTSALILQMPRGNLETIYPRALVLPVIRDCINQRKYKKAFLTCRNHRVDMNIIHDHAPDQFLRHTGDFIDQLKRVESIDLFLSQLREEDVSVTMYKETLPRRETTSTENHHIHQPPNTRFANDSKVNRICLTFLEALNTRRATNLQNVITAHVCQNPPALEDGLLEIAKLRLNSPEVVDRAVEHICFLADVNRLFDTALGMYDLDMTLLIAQQSQRDPREYLPFLQRLKELEPLRMHVDIDNHLRRYVKVLHHYQQLDDFASFKQHMVKHELYEQAIEMFRYQENSLTEIMQSYAEYLEAKSRHKDAGIAYEYLKDYKPAAESYRLAHMWQEALSCANLVPFDADKLQSFASVIADSLIELKDYKSAAVVQLEYLKNLEAATRSFCKGYYFADATRVLGLYGRHEMLESIVDVGLAEGQATITEMLAEMKGQLNAQVPRIRELRIKKAEEPLAFYDADATGGADIPDNVSLAGTDASTVGGTLFTRYTNRTGTVATNATRATSKKRIREERKRARGKKGSVYEEEYLINSVARLIERANSIGEDVQRLVMGLMRRGMRERARAVENAMLEVVQLCRDCSQEVFQTVAKEELTMPDQRPPGGDGVMWDSMEQVQAIKEAPIIRAFEKLSIVGG